MNGSRTATVDDHIARWAPAYRALPVARRGERRQTLGIDRCRVRWCAQSPCWADCTTSTRWRRQLRPCNRSRLATEPFAIPAHPFKFSIPCRRTRFLRSTGAIWDTSGTPSPERTKGSVVHHQLTPVKLGSPTWARTRDLRINRPPLDLAANPHECSLFWVRASNISCPFHPKKAREGSFLTTGYWKRRTDGFHAG